MLSGSTVCPLSPYCGILACLAGGRFASSCHRGGPGRQGVSRGTGPRASGPRLVPSRLLADQPPRRSEVDPCLQSSHAEGNGAVCSGLPSLCRQSSCSWPSSARSRPHHRIPTRHVSPRSKARSTTWRSGRCPLVGASPLTRPSAGTRSARRVLPAQPGRRDSPARPVRQDRPEPQACRARRTRPNGTSRQEHAQAPVDVDCDEESHTIFPAGTKLTVTDVEIDRSPTSTVGARARSSTRMRTSRATTATTSGSSTLTPRERRAAPSDHPRRAAFDLRCVGTGGGQRILRRHQCTFSISRRSSPAR